MTPLETFGLFLVLLVVLVVLSRFRDWPAVTVKKQTYMDHDWLVKEQREAELKAASMPHLFKGYKTHHPPEER